MSTDDGACEKHIVVAEEELLELPLPTYSCEFCGLNVKTRANLRAHHVKTHRILKSDSDVAFYTKQRCQFTYVYHCPVVPCRHNIGGGAGFSTSSRLKQHYQNVHMHKSYKCDKCGCLFSTPSNHAYHMRFCGKLFVCPICPRSYSFKKHLDQHFRRSGHQPVDRPYKRLKRASQPPDQRQSCVEIRPNDLPKLVSSFSTSFTSREGGVSAISDPTTVMAPAAALSSPSVILPVLIFPFPMYCSGESAQLGYPVSATDQACLTGNLLLTQFGYFASSDPSCSSGTESIITTQLSKELVKLEQQPVETTNPCISLEVSQYDFACQFDNSFPSSETGTQTEAASFSQELTPLEASAPSVSVNTCTDEDDISAFIGSLFCDASVETRYPRPHLVHEFTDTGLDVLDPTSIEVATTGELSLPVQYLVGDNLLDIPGDGFISSNENGVVPCITDNCDTALSEGTALHPNAHAEVQTDLKSKSHAAAATHDTPFYWNSDTDLRRSILITPPLLSDGPILVPTTAGSQLHQRVERSLTTSSLSRHAYKLDPYAAPLDLTSQPLDSSCTSNAEYCTFGADYRPYLFSPGISPGALSSHSVGLQSTPWPPAPLCSSIASQTLTDDWESWLNSVHTQTNTSPLSLTDMCIGANDEFLSEPFEQSANMNDVASLINHF